MDYQKIIEEVYAEVSTLENKGQVAQYIPELRNIDPNHFGVHISTLDGYDVGIGDNYTKFSIQSISKVLSLTLAYNLQGGELWKRVGVEPSGTPFNSLVQLEHDHGIPRNPMINAGAIVICDILISNFNNPKNELLTFIREITQNSEITINQKVVQSEKSVGYRNTALINLMKAFGNIKNDIDQVLDLYFSICSIEMTCQELSRAFLFLANDGIDPITHHQILTLSKSKRVNAIMQSCGFYDEAGEFSFRVGLPGKSGVGGGIVAVHPEYFSIAVWSPRLNKKGNSYRGLKFLEQFTTQTGLSVF
uniref:Glutaminase n=1 Tax=Roseihalotalea indica TaxID=2867963 RepID=A0AA49JID7_9BACT|nr:glutaminase [Tunicatimonas sp. TK19036]